MSYSGGMRSTRRLQAACDKSRATLLTSERVRESRTYGVVRLKREYVGFILQSPYGRAENDASEIVFEFGPVTDGMIRRQLACC